MSTVIFWFRSDLRLHDQPALMAACRGDTSRLVPVVCLPAENPSTRWGFDRLGPHRRAWWHSAVEGLQRQLASMGCPLWILQGAACDTLPTLVRSLGAKAIVCEDIAAPEEQAEVAALRAAGCEVHTVWQSSVLAPDRLPGGVQQLRAVFSVFRRAVEAHPDGVVPPLPAPRQLPEGVDPGHHGQCNWIAPPPAPDARSSFPYGQAPLNGGEACGLAHAEAYLRGPHAAGYNRTRNDLAGFHYSSKWSPWLATGALSARWLWARLREVEAEQGANDGTYWLGFELLWRDYFRLLHLQQGRALYRARGLSQHPRPSHDEQRFRSWCQGRTGEPLIDAAMRELAVTGYLSNRLRQVVASYLIYDLACDWRAGAAWFEAQLLDYDVYSNQGNWLYIAGRGTDPRGGRRFNVSKQVAEHDPDGAYRARWASGDSPTVFLKGEAPCAF